MDEQTLEPCPFCGETELRVAFSHEAGRWDIWEVECETCCVSKDGELGHVGDEARQSAIDAWNHRAAHSVIAGKVAELEDALAWAENHDPQLVDAIRARAALAPYPERRSD